MTAEEFLDGDGSFLASISGETKARGLAGFMLRLIVVGRSVKADQLEGRIGAEEAASQLAALNEVNQVVAQQLLGALDEKAHQMPPEEFVTHVLKEATKGRIDFYVKWAIGAVAKRGVGSPGIGES